jgi:hypothetical protein
MKLNLGCGEFKKEGYINIDKRKDANPDLILEIGIESFPQENGSVSEIYAHNSLEHFPNFADVVSELGRISKNGCIWKITLPYATTYVYNVINPYHLSPFFTENTFRFWDDIYRREQPDDFRLKIIKTDFTYNTALWGSTNDWEKLRQTNINVVQSFYQEIEVIK